MTRTEVAVLALRLTALYLILAAVIQLSDVAIFAAGGITEEESRLYFLGLLRSTLVRALLGIALFVAAPRIARSMSGGDEQLRLEDHAAIGVIAVRVAAVALWDAALTMVPNIMSVPTWLPSKTKFSITLGSALAFAALGTCLFFAAPAIGRRFFGSRTGPMVTTRTSALASIAFAAIGLWIVSGALPHFATALADSLEFADVEFRHSWAEVITAGFRVALGTFLFVGGGAVAHLWHKLSTAGLLRRNGAA